MKTTNNSVATLNTSKHTIHPTSLFWMNMYESHNADNTAKPFKPKRKKHSTMISRWSRGMLEK